jgi:hypothetical protein
VNLPHRRQGKVIHMKLVDKAAAIMFDLLAVVRFREPQIEPGTWSLALASLPRAECVRQPSQVG